jgi:carbon-monoxide dehydrogenase medium subunit
LYIGASVTVNQISRSKDVRNKYLALAQGADNLASYQLRNRATLVGNICNASPGGDLAPPLLVFDGMVEIVGPNGRRMVPLKEFFTGVKRTILKSNELVLGVLLPDVSPNDRSTYMKQARLKGHDLATVGVALRIDSDRKVYIAMAAVAPTPIRLKELEETINARTLDKETVLLAVKEVVRHIQPISDVRSSAEYRLHVAGVLLKRGLLTLMDKEVG